MPDYPIFHSQYSKNQIEASVGKNPVISDHNTWMVWDIEAMAWVDTGIVAEGSDAEVTAENIETALGYTPADDDDVAELKETITDKQDKLIAGENITIAEDGKTISATGGGGGNDWELIEKHTDLTAETINIITNAKLSDYKKFMVVLLKEDSSSATIGYLRAYGFNDYNLTGAKSLGAAASPLNARRVFLFVELLPENVVHSEVAVMPRNPVQPAVNADVATSNVPDDHLLFGIYNNNGQQCYDGTETLFIFGVRR